MHRVAVTGMGLTAALGPNLSKVWHRLVAGESGVGPITYFDASQYACKVAAEAKHALEIDLDKALIPLDFCRRGVRLFAKSVQEAYADSSLNGSGLAPNEIGVAAGASVNYLHMGLLRHYFQFRRPDTATLDLERFGREGRQPAKNFWRQTGDMMAEAPAKLIVGAAGPTLVLDTACAASAYAIGQAFRLIQRGKVKAMIAGGGAGLVTPIGILAFSLLGALSRNPNPAEASRPFDLHRDGFVMGEAGGAVVLEEWAHAKARGAKVYAELAGFGTTVNASANLTDPSPDGICEEQAMRLALQDASLEPEDIDYIAAHGTSTAKNDVMETRIVKRLFGRHARRLMLSSNKGQIGHTIAAAGVCNLIFAAKALCGGCVPPTAHYRNPDSQCDLDYVPNVARRASLRAALVNAFAFGGQNAVLAIRAA